LYAENQSFRGGIKKKKKKTGNPRRDMGRPIINQ
jgi:hypothetical protein